MKRNLSQGQHVKLPPMSLPLTRSPRCRTIHEPQLHWGYTPHQSTTPPHKPCSKYASVLKSHPHHSPHPQGRHAADRYHLRTHRARSVILTSAELVEIRAAQRTFEGAYIRTAIGQFSFALIVLKIFTAEFYSIGALFAVYGAGILGISVLRRQQGEMG